MENDKKHSPQRTQRNNCVTKEKTLRTQRKNKNKKENSHGLTPCTVVPPYPNTVILPYGAGRVGG